MPRCSRRFGGRPEDTHAGDPNRRRIVSRGHDRDPGAHRHSLGPVPARVRGAGGEHRADPPGDAGRPPHVPRAGRAVPPPHRGLRQERPRHQCHRRHQPGCVEAGRRSRPAVRGRGARRSAPLRADDREGQLRDHRPAERERLAGAGRLRVRQGCIPGEAREGGRRHRAREVEHGGVGVHAVRDRQFDPAGLHEEPVRPRPRDRRFERRNGCGSRRQFRGGGPRQRHRQLDSRSLIAPVARRHPLDDGADEPGRGDAALHACRYRGPHDAHRGRRGGGVPGRRGGGSRPTR